MLQSRLSGDPPRGGEAEQLPKEGGLAWEAQKKLAFVIVNEKINVGDKKEGPVVDTTVTRALSSHVVQFAAPQKTDPNAL